MRSLNHLLNLQGTCQGSWKWAGFLLPGICLMWTLLQLLCPSHISTQV
uniref:Alternative protein OFD1 n=1 Tax=Homo sapiens TaxID=9606 RepID=L8E7V8_HUMAN|nr:alternative protein OFD1 [Homo sapiens]